MTHNPDNTIQEQSTSVHKNFDALDAFLALVLTVLFAVGIVGHRLSQFQPLLITMTEGFLLFTNLLVTAAVLARAWYTGSRPSFFKLSIWMAVCVILTLIIEILGVRTGLIFGQYEYGSVFRLTVAGVPWVIGWNWVLVILGALTIARTSYLLTLSRVIFPAAGLEALDKASKQPWFWFLQHLDIAFLAGLLAVLFDIALEPVAIKFDYWRWPGNIVPLQNYAAWFCITFVFSIIALRFNIATRSKLVMFYSVIQAVFFVMLLI